MFSLTPAQLPGLPEICKKSLSECPAAGDRDLFIVGKNFMKGTRVIFSQPGKEGTVIWERNAEIDLEYFQQVKDVSWFFLTFPIWAYDLCLTQKIFVKIDTPLSPIQLRGLYLP